VSIAHWYRFWPERCPTVEMLTQQMPFWTSPKFDNPNPEGMNKHLLDVAVCTSKPAVAGLRARQVPIVGNVSDVVAQHFNMRRGIRSSSWWQGISIILSVKDLECHRSYSYRALLMLRQLIPRSLATPNHETTTCNVRTKETLASLTRHKPREPRPGRDIPEALRDVCLASPYPRTYNILHADFVRTESI
jgi:hypothetical protein